MRLIIQNFGPIQKGEIDLSKNIFLFVGLNNSGKTYVAHLLWAIFNTDYQDSFVNLLLKEERVSNLMTIENNELVITQELLDNILGRFAEFVRETILPDTLNISTDHFIIKDSYIAVQCELDSIQNQQSKLKSVIGVPASKKEYEIFEITKDRGSLLVRIENKPEETDFYDYIPRQFFDKAETQRQSVLKLIVNLIFGGNENEASFYLPASRLFYSIFNRYIIRHVKEDREEEFKKIFEALNSKKGINKQELLSKIKRGNYTKPMDALMTEIYKLNEDEVEPTSYYDRLVSRLEGNIMRGDMIFEGGKLPGGASDTYLRVDKQEDKKLAMYLSSSAINQSSAVYYFFKYWAKEKNNFLIIDEPEENLHPSSQIALCNLLIEFATQNSNKLLIITHSPLIAENINNYIYLHLLKNKYNKPVEEIVAENQWNLQTDLSIAPEEIGTYFFGNNRITTYEPGTYGIHFNTFLKVSEEVKNISISLAEQIYTEENKDVLEE